MTAPQIPTAAPVAMMLAALWLGGCASHCAYDGPLPVSESKQQRYMLNEGYSMLRRDARTIGAVRLLLYVKFESDEFDEVVSAVSGFGRKLGRQLDRLAGDYPALRLDLDPLPVLEVRKRFATGIDRFREISPLGGKAGMEYERTLLISLSNGLNQERHLVSEMAEDEPEPGLRQFLLATRREMDRHHERATRLLERKYFARPRED